MALVERSPAIAGSALLHAGLAAAALLSFPAAKEAAKLQTAIPVTIIAAPPAAELRPPVEADEPQEAAAETPVPAAPPEPPAAVQAPEPTPAPAPPPPPPAPRPAPTPPAPRPAAKPEPKPSPTKPTPPKPATPKPTPAPAKPAATKPTPAAAKPKPSPARPAPAAARPAVKADESGLDLAALATDLAKTSGATRSSAPKGPPRPRTAPAAARGSGGSSADLLGPVVNRIQRGWNPNCNVPGADDIRIRVRFSLTPDGALARAPELLDGQNPSGSSLEDVAAARALRAINAAAPFSELPPDRYDEWRSFTANFNAKQACAAR